MRIDRVPTTAAAKRQPTLLSCPNSWMPAPIIHLPSGGWTMKSPVSSTPQGSPASNAGLGSSGHSRSYPNWVSDQPSFT